MNPAAILALISSLVVQADALAAQLDAAQRRMAELEQALTEAQKPDDLVGGGRPDAGAFTVDTSGDQTLFTLSPDGAVRLSEGVDTSPAAAGFWEAVAKAAPAGMSLVLPGEGHEPDLLDDSAAAAIAVPEVERLDD